MDMWFLRHANGETNNRTNRHADHNTLHSYWSKVTTVVLSKQQ